MKKYSSYKDSGVKWIGEIPSHWELIKFKYLLNYKKGRNPKDFSFEETSETEMYLSVYYLRDNPKRTLYVEDSENYIKVDDNEILLLWDGYNAGEFILSKRGIISSSMAIINLKGIDKEYSWYYLKFFEPQLKTSTIRRGTQKVDSEEFKNAIFVLPKKSERTAIVAFLDRKTAEIDELIADKKRLLELYEEEKNTTIDQAITGKLKIGNEELKMKDSGVEWIGEIPSHWELRSLKHIGKSIAGIVYSPEDVVANKENAKLVLRSSNIQDGKLTLSDLVFVTTSIKDDQILRKGDILICSTNGEEAFIGKNILIDDSIAGSTFGTFMTAFRTDIFDFVYYYFNSQVFKGQIALFKTSTINNLTINTLNNFVIALPPISEQKSIVEFIEKKCKRIDAKISHIEKLIKLLTEYRTALISEVITGKIKVFDD